MSSKQVDVIQSLPCYLDNETSPFGIANILFCGRLVRDRFNVLNQYSKVNWLDTVDPIPEPVETPIADLMDQRANELISKGSIGVQWSGGVDSTSLLLALIRNGIAKEDLEVLYDANSCSEYPKLFTWLSEQGWNMHPVDTSWLQVLGKTDVDVITNGWCADQLFGSVFFYQMPEKYLMSLDEFLNDLKFPGIQPNQEQKKFAIEVYKKYAKDYFGIDLNVAAELGWFINFVIKWSWVKAFNDCYLIRTKNSNKTQVFYNTDYFQSWALNNYHSIKEANIYGKNAAMYKRPLKEYCQTIFKDDDFLQNKSKKPSWNASQNRTMYNKTCIVLKINNGYDVYDAPAKFPYLKAQEFINEIFTRYSK